MIDILLVEDNKELSNLVTKFLERDGYSICQAADGNRAIEKIHTENVRLVLLDIMLPGLDGFAVCSAIRENGNIPIIIMSAMLDKEHKLKGYELGADDYVEKPFDIDLLRVKIRALMNRSYENKKENHVIEIGDVSLDLDAHRGFLSGKELELNVKEFELLKLLMQNAGKTLHKEYLFNEIWGFDCYSENQTLTVHIKRLRDKIEKDPKKPEHILTVWGVGYQYETV